LIYLSAQPNEEANINDRIIIGKSVNVAFKKYGFFDRVILNFGFICEAA
jgi:hypothetical protein